MSCTQAGRRVVKPRGNETQKSVSAKVPSRGHDSRRDVRGACLRRAFPLLLIFFNPHFLAAQEEPSAVPVSQDTALFSRGASSSENGAGSALRNRTSFGHDIEIYSWQTQHDFHKRLAHGWELELYEDFKTVLQRQARGDAWKDDHNAGLRLSRQMSKFWRFEAAAASKIFFDEFTGSARNTASAFSNNDFSLNRFDARSELTLAQRLRLAPGLGYRWEDVLARKDYGPHAEIKLALAPTRWAEYDHQFELDAQIDAMPARRNDDFAVTYGVARQFERNAADSLFVRFNHARRENYFTTRFVDQVNRSRRGLENRLQYRVGEAWLFYLNSELSEAEVQVEWRPYVAHGRRSDPVGGFQRADLETQHRVQIFWQNDKLNNDLALIYRARQRAYEIPDSLRDSPELRRYAGEGYDSDDWDLALWHNLQWQIGRKDSLRWFGRLTRYAHDTANLENPNDYDRLQMQGNVLYEHRFHDRLRVRWEARSYLEHHVYLKSNLSGDNRWLRIWQLLPQLLFGKEGGLLLKQSFGVRATYIDYDFPEALSNRRSLVLRDFFLADSLTAPLRPHATLELQYKLSLEERGLLNWEQWLQSPQAEIRRHAFILQMRQNLARHWDFTPGVSYYQETNWTFQTRPGQSALRTFSHEQIILSPMLHLSYIRPPHTMILFNARRQLSFRKSAGGAARRDEPIDTFNLAVQWAW